MNAHPAVDVRPGRLSAHEIEANARASNLAVALLSQAEAAARQALRPGSPMCCVRHASRRDGAMPAPYGGQGACRQLGLGQSRMVRVRARQVASAPTGEADRAKSGRGRERIACSRRAPIVVSVLRIIIRAPRVVLTYAADSVPAAYC